MSKTGWSIGGLNLRDGRFEIDVTDGWDAMPARRGSNIEIPYRHGSLVVPEKFYRPKRMLLSVLVLPHDASGAVTHAEGARAHIRENLDDLFGALYSDALISLQRTEPDYPGAGTVTWESLVEVTEVVPVDSAIGVLARRVLLRLTMPSPFWRILPEKTGETPPTVTNDGNAPVSDMVITFTGGATPRLTNSTTGDYIEIADAAMANPVTVDVGARTVTQNGSPADALLVRARDRWMEFAPGANSLALTGGGSVSIDFYSKAF